ncbi:MAG: alpha/beta hydrolase [Bdellovibrionales bacterium]|nr:alpha/beta hydrolase [Bdellovibrionales bacterium]
MSYLQNFNYQLYGQETKPKLVLLHGLMGYGQNWRTIARHLEPYFHILTYDQRGHGKSFHPDSDYGPQNYADDLNKILQELGWNKIILMGHSMGGRNAIYFAHQFPKTVEALIIEDIGPESSSSSIHRLEEIIESVAVPYSSKKEAKDDLLHKHSPTLAQFLISSLEEVNGEVVWRLSKRGILQSLYSGREQSHWKEWQGISAPSLVIRGEKSTDLDKETFQKMLSTNPNAKGVEIAKAGHWVHFEQPDAVTSAVKDFLEGIKLL